MGSTKDTTISAALGMVRNSMEMNPQLPLNKDLPEEDKEENLEHASPPLLGVNGDVPNPPPSKGSLSVQGVPQVNQFRDRRLQQQMEPPPAHQKRGTNLNPPISGPAYKGDLNSPVPTSPSLTTSQERSPAIEDSYTPRSQHTSIVEGISGYEGSAVESTNFLGGGHRFSDQPPMPASRPTDPYPSSGQWDVPVNRPTWSMAEELRQSLKLTPKEFFHLILEEMKGSDEDDDNNNTLNACANPGPEDKTSGFLLLLLTSDSLTPEEVWDVYDTCQQKLTPFQGRTLAERIWRRKY